MPPNTPPLFRPSSVPPTVPTTPPIIPFLDNPPNKPLPRPLTVYPRNVAKNDVTPEAYFSKNSTKVLKFLASLSPESL